MKKILVRYNTNNIHLFPDCTYKITYGVDYNRYYYGVDCNRYYYTRYINFRIVGIFLNIIKNEKNIS